VFSYLQLLDKELIMRYLTILTLLFLCTLAFAQKPVPTSPLSTPSTYCDETSVWKQDGNLVIDKRDGHIQSVSQLSEGPFAGTPEQIAQSFLDKHQDWIGLLPASCNLKPVRTAETPLGFHVTYELMTGDIPVYPGNLVVTMNRKNEVVFYF
jgi:hypothetical protein